MTINRRDFLKAHAAAAAAATVGVQLPGAALAQTAAPAIKDELKWDKAPCRFCGTGCGVLVGTKDGRVVATQGDPDAPVNKGLNCIKGYFLSKIMYGEDRLTTPLLRMKDGKYDKNGEFTPVSWDEAFDMMAEKCKDALKEKGPTAVGMFGSGQWTIWEGYAAAKLFKAGFRSNNLDPERAPLHGVGRGGLHAHLRHRRADGLLRRRRARRRVRAVGLEHGRDASDPVVAPDRPPADEPARQGRGAVDLRAPQLRSRRLPSCVHAADRPGDAQLHLPTTSSRPAA